MCRAFSLDPLSYLFVVLATTPISMDLLVACLYLVETLHFGIGEPIYMRFSQYSGCDVRPESLEKRVRASLRVKYFHTIIIIEHDNISMFAITLNIQPSVKKNFGVKVLSIQQSFIYIKSLPNFKRHLTEGVVVVSLLQTLFRSKGLRQANPSSGESQCEGVS